MRYFDLKYLLVRHLGYLWICIIEFYYIWREHRAAIFEAILMAAICKIGSRSLSYTIYLETALLNIFGQKSVIENMADCDVKRVTVPYFFRMIADQ